MAVVEGIIALGHRLWEMPLYLCIGYGKVSLWIEMGKIIFDGDKALPDFCNSWHKGFAGGVNGILGRLPEVSLPQLPESLRPSRSSRSSTFEVIYLDEDTRIIRGASGELRIFMKTAA